MYASVNQGGTHPIEPCDTVVFMVHVLPADVRIWNRSDLGDRYAEWVRCNVPPMRQADVFGTSSGTLFGKIDISNAIRDGKAVILAHKSQLDSHEWGCPRRIAETSVVVIVSLSRLGAATKYTSTRSNAHLMEGTYRWQYQCRQGGERRRKYRSLREDNGARSCASPGPVTCT